MPKWLKVVAKGAFAFAKAARRTRLLKGKGVDEMIEAIEAAVPALKDPEPVPSDGMRPVRKNAPNS